MSIEPDLGGCESLSLVKLGLCVQTVETGLRQVSAARYSIKHIADNTCMYSDVTGQAGEQSENERPKTSAKIEAPPY